MYCSIYYALKQIVETMMYDYQLIALRDIKTDHKIEAVLSHPFIHEDDIELIRLDLYGVGLKEYLVEVAGQQRSRQFEMFVRTNVFDYNWVFRSLFVSDPQHVGHKLATCIFVNMKFIPHFILEKLTPTNVKLLACHRYGRTRDRQAAIIKKEIEPLLNCDDVVGIVVEYIYPQFFDFMPPQY
jgi:hypothetical protein